MRYRFYYDYLACVSTHVATGNHPRPFQWCEPSRFNFEPFDTHRELLGYTFDVHVAHTYDDHQVASFMVRADRDDYALMQLRAQTLAYAKRAGIRMLPAHSFVDSSPPAA